MKAGCKFTCNPAFILSDMVMATAVTMKNPKDSELSLRKDMEGEGYLML